MSDEPLLDTVEDVEREAEEAGDRLTFGDVLDRVEERGYGPLIAFLSAFVILPTGMIPGVPAVIGLCLLLIGGQMLWGREHPWFPDLIKRRRIDGDKLDRALETAKPWAEKLSFLLKERYCALAVGGVANRVTAAFVVIGALLMTAMGFIPGLPAALGGALLLIGLGVTGRDGLVTLAGYIVFALGLWLAWHYAPM